MSSQTPNINLTLPAGSENVSRQIINENNTKIDTAIGSLSDSFKISVSSLSDLNSIISGMASGERKVLLFTGAVTNSLVNHNAASIATVCKMDAAGITDMLLFSLGGNYIGTVRYASSTSSVTKEIAITPISKVTVTGTTSSSGAISSGLLNKTIIGAVLKDQNAAYVCLASYSASGVPWITVYSNNNMAPAGNKSVSIDVYYIDS